MLFTLPDVTSVEREIPGHGLRRIEVSTLFGIGETCLFWRPHPQAQEVSQVITQYGRHLEVVAEVKEGRWDAAILHREAELRELNGV